MRQRTRIAIALTLVALVAACTGRPVNPDAVVAQRQATAQKIVHDVTIVVIAANKDGKISDQSTAAILRIDQQVSDVIRDNPQGWLAVVQTVVKNGREALPPALQAQVSTFLDALLAKLGGVMTEVR